MIEDLDGATSEPTQHGHVVVLSAVIASVSLALLVALVVAPRSGLDTAPLAASPAQSVSAGPVTTLTIQTNPVSQLRVDLSRVTVCPDGTRLIPPYQLSVDGGTGRIFAARWDRGSVISVPVNFAFDPRTGWFTVTCATSDVAAPWEWDSR